MTKEDMWGYYLDNVKLIKTEAPILGPFEARATFLQIKQFDALHLEFQQFLFSNYITNEYLPQQVKESSKFNHFSNQKIDFLLMFSIVKAVEIHFSTKNKNLFFQKLNIAVEDDVDIFNLQFILKIYESFANTIECDIFEMWGFSSKRLHNNIAEGWISYFWNFFNHKFGYDLNSFYELKYDIIFKESIKLSLVIEELLLNLNYVYKIYDYSSYLSSYDSSTIITDDSQGIVDTDVAVDNISDKQMSVVMKKDILKIGKKYSKFKKKIYKFSRLFKWEKLYDRFLEFSPPSYSGRYFISKNLGNVVPMYKRNEFSRYYSNLEKKFIILLSFQAYTYSRELYLCVKDLLLVKTTRNHYVEFRKIKSIKETLDRVFINKTTVSLYFIHTYDFRGRIYPKNPFSLTSVKILRYCMVTKGSNHTYKNKYYFIFLKYISLLNTNTIISKINLSEEKKVFILVGLLMIGKIDKNKLKVESKVELKDFLKRGLEIFDLYKNNYDLKSLGYDAVDLAYLLTQLKKLNEYISKNVTFSVVVDSTASAYLHLNMWCRVKAEYSRILNIDSKYMEIWHDTYDYIITMTKNKIKNYDKKFDAIFNRKYLKKVIMTMPYKVSYKSAEKYFFVDINLDKVAIDKKEIVEMFKLFFKLLPLVFSEIYILYFRKITIFDNKFKVFNNFYDFNYYKLEAEDISKKIYGKKIDCQIHIPTEELDLRKTKTALVANIMHSTDSLFISLIFKKFHKIGAEIYFIHDEFIFDISLYFYFLQVANESYNELYFELTFEKSSYDSVFIVI